MLQGLLWSKLPSSLSALKYLFLISKFHLCLLNDPFFFLVQRSLKTLSLPITCLFFSYFTCICSLKLSFLKLVLMLPGRGRRRTEHSWAGVLHWALVETGQQELKFSSALLRKCSLCVREGERYSEKDQKNAFLASDFFLSPFHAFPLPFFSTRHA